MNAGEAAASAEVARWLRAAILAGEFPDGLVPSRVALGRRFGVSPETASVALRMLHAEGLITLEQGKRSRVLPVRRYEVTVLVPLGGPVEEPLRAKAERRVQVEQDDDPAISGAAVTAGAGRLEVALAVTAADSGRAAARAIGVATYACPAADGWDLAGASVSARPA